MQKRVSPRIFKILILFFIAVICIYFFLCSSFFNIDKITVTSVEKVSKAEIIEISGIERGNNIFKIDNRLCARSIEIHPMVKDVKIIRSLPREIKIDVEERKMWAVLPYNDTFLCLDPEGICIDRMVNFAPEGYCLITLDILPECVNLGHAVVSPGIEVIRQIYEALPEESRKNISEFHYISGENEVIIFTIKGTEIKFGNLDRLEEKVKMIAQIFSMEVEVEQKGTGVLKYVDIRFDGQPVLKMK